MRDQTPPTPELDTLGRAAERDSRLLALAVALCTVVLVLAVGWAVLTAATGRIALSVVVLAVVGLCFWLAGRADRRYRGR